VASRFLLKFAQHTFLIYTTALTSVMLSPYSSRICVVTVRYCNGNLMTPLARNPKVRNNSGVV
jgi:hypothetical protein